MNTSILNPFGSLSCGTGNLSAAMGKGGGLMPRSLVAASEGRVVGRGRRGRGRGLLGGRRESCERARERCCKQQRPPRREADGHAILPDRAFTWPFYLAAVSDRSHPKRNRNRRSGVDARGPA